MRRDTLALKRQEITDERAKRASDASRSKIVAGEVVDCDDANRKAAIRIEGKTVASAGIDYGEHAPVVGDKVLVDQAPLNGKRRIVAITSRDAGYVASGILTTPAIVATAVPGFVAKAQLTLETNLIYRPGFMVFRDDGTRSHLMTPYVNQSGQILAVFDAWSEVVDGNRTRLTIAATVITVGGIPSLDWVAYVLRERADVPKRS